MGVSCFNLNLLLEGNNFYSKVGKRDSSGLGWASTPPQVQYHLDSATASCHHPSIMTTDSIQPQRLNCPKSLPHVTLFSYAVRVSRRTHHHSLSLQHLHYELCRIQLPYRILLQ